MIGNKYHLDVRDVCYNQICDAPKKAKFEVQKNRRACLKLCMNVKERQNNTWAKNEISPEPNIQ